MAHEFSTFEARDHIVTITINRPDQRNALHKPAHRELAAAFDAFEDNPDYWVAIVTGAGEKAFCAGADLKNMASGEPMPETGFAGLTSRFARKKPVIAAVNGSAFGGGFEVALACDVIVASDNARFGLTEPRVGLVAMAGGVQRLIREIGPKRAFGMLLTGRQVSAQEGQELGFVNEVVPAGEALKAAQRWAGEILQCSPASIRATKEIATHLDGQSVQASIDGMMSLPIVGQMLSGPDAKEGPRAFAERRTPRWSNP